MKKRGSPNRLPTVVVDASLATPLYQQLYEGLRNTILTGQLQAGWRLPSTRALTTDLGISRATVQLAFEQLIAEGYLEGRSGSGTYVSAALPTEGFLSTAVQTNRTQLLTQDRAISQRASVIMTSPYIGPPLRIPGKSWPRAFRVGQPAYDAFPHKTWESLLVRSWRQMPQDLLTYHRVAGYLPLREAIAEYLATARGVRCTARQVIIVCGSQQGIDLTARVLLDPGERVWIEDPGYTGARGAFLAAGARLVPVPLDAEGMVVDLGKARDPDARIAFVTPSHQFPMGMTMSLVRRISLLEWARTAGAWILEDDYDSEFRYVGRPLAALQGLDTTDRVIYLGTFSKVLFPALRLGYLVVPPDLVSAFVRAHLFTTVHLPLLEQIALAAFLSEGHFTRHIRRMRQLYHERQELLLEGARQELTGLLDVQPNPAGMHLIGWLPHNRDDRQITYAAASAGVDVMPISHYCLETHERPGILLGYTAVGREEMQAGVRSLARVLV